MTIDRNELIETAATVLHNGHSCMSWEEAKKLAEAVLKAIGEYLPDLGVYIKDNTQGRVNIRRAERGTIATELYTQFKNICEGK